MEVSWQEVPAPMAGNPTLHERFFAWFFASLISRNKSRFEGVKRGIFEDVKQGSKVLEIGKGTTGSSFVQWGGHFMLD